MSASSVSAWALNLCKSGTYYSMGNVPILEECQKHSLVVMSAWVLRDQLQVNVVCIAYNVPSSRCCILPLLSTGGRHSHTTVSNNTTIWVWDKNIAGCKLSNCCIFFVCAYNFVRQMADLLQKRLGFQPIYVLVYLLLVAVYLRTGPLYKCCTATKKKIQISLVISWHDTLIPRKQIASSSPEV